MTPTELLAALEAATGPSRELDAEIGKILHPDPDDIGDLCSRYGDWPGPFTASLDAALTLVPEGWSYCLMLSENKKNPIVRLGRSYPTNANVTQEARTMPVCICIAAIRARGEG